MLRHNMVAADRTQVTYRYERWRALSSGVFEVAATVFLLYIAVKHYNAGPIAKAMIAGGGSLGLMLAPWFVSRVEAAAFRPHHDDPDGDRGDFQRTDGACALTSSGILPASAADFWRCIRAGGFLPWTLSFSRANGFGRYPPLPC